MVEGTDERIRLYLGTGCGKTTATFGLLLRGLSKGKKITLVFFDKVEENSSEGDALRYLSSLKNEKGFGELQVYYTGVNRIGTGPQGGFRFYSSANGILPEDRQAAQQGLSYVKDALIDHDNIVIADEVLDVARVGIIDWQQAKDTFALRQDPTVLVLTGRRAPDWLMEMATTISVTTQLRHHGRAIPGIDC